jgi:hypothetical protein
MAARATMTEHFATTNSFVIECVCGRIFSELTEERARQRFEDHLKSAADTGKPEVGCDPPPAGSDIPCMYGEGCFVHGPLGDA